ncbi:hypothetical protein FOZ60_016020 [Perkinsus olseni]|uniref:Uncharacterized protein n=1 Tax=Perkinsus olseni TaxID=32597 RepID=A0A7J6P543_PEROL|nr:hypothetical protein FOZ60_016020 [Perkinsus olseni]
MIFISHTFWTLKVAFSESLGYSADLTLKEISIGLKSTAPFALIPFVYCVTARRHASINKLGKRCRFAPAKGAHQCPLEPARQTTPLEMAALWETWYGMYHNPNRPVGSPLDRRHCRRDREDAGG